MENTRVKFYFTGVQDREFVKLSFEQILFPGYNLNEDDIIDTISNFSIPSLMDKYDISMIFDLAIISCTKTKASGDTIKLLDIKRGKLLFGATESGEFDVDEYSSISDLKHQLTLVNIKLETSDLKLQTAELKLQAANDSIVTLTSLNQSLADRFKLSAKSYWIEPNGTLHEVRFAGHNEFAFEYLVNTYGIDYIDKHEYEYPYSILTDLGWVRVLGWTEPPSFVFPTKMTPKQIRVVKEYCQTYSCDLPKSLISI